MRHKKTIGLAVLLLMLLAAGPRVWAQPEATDLTALGVQLWPDYDEQSMLVLLTGTLSPETALPATVTIPVPPGADINAVARYTTDNQLLSDVVYRIENDQLIMTMPDLRFQVEYYAPYATDGDRRTFDFSWLSGLPVAQLSAVVQQPLAAETIEIVPQPVNVSADRGDGLQYHSLAAQSVAAGEPFDINVTYTNPTGALSAPALAAGVGDVSGAVETTAPPATGGLFDDFNPLWLLGIVGVAALVGLAWYFGRRQTVTTANRTRKPAPSRTAKPQPSRPSTPPKPPTTAAVPPPPATSPPAQPPSSAAAPRFCHQCGEPVVDGDKFCRNCGAVLKTAV